MDALAVPADPERARMLSAACTTEDAAASVLAAAGGFQAADMESVRPPVSGATSKEQPALATSQQPIMRQDKRPRGSTADDSIRRKFD
jgi:hypothetical protein